MFLIKAACRKKRVSNGANKYLSFFKLGVRRKTDLYKEKEGTNGNEEDFIGRISSAFSNDRDCNCNNNLTSCHRSGVVLQQ